MDAYSFLTEDTRYHVPTVTLAFARSESHAREQALERLRENDFHLAVEVCVAEMFLFKVTRADLGGWNDVSAQESFEPLERTSGTS